VTRKNKILGVILLSAVPAVGHAAATSGAASRRSDLLPLAALSAIAHAIPAATPAPPPPDELLGPELAALRGKFFDAGKEKAPAEMSTFRPLCDTNGYPLVGNAVGKSMYQPSQFCAEVRKGNK
jgi:hypothetical protein